MNSDTGKWIIVIGGLLTVVGLFVYFFHDKLHWIGHLPGDIRIEKENFSFYFPLTTMIIFSVVASLLIQLFRRFLG